MTRLTGWLGTCATLVLLVASCGARDSNNAESPDASTSIPSYAPSPEQQVRAAYVSARQAEGATDPAYAFHADGNAMVAMHPESRMRARVDAEGITLSQAGEAWSAKLHTGSIACEGTTGGVAYRGVSASDKSNHVQTEKSAGEQHFTEWYTQGALGLEQGWTLHENPCASGPLEVRVDVEKLSVVEAKNGLELRDATGRHTVRYTDGWARDANGRALATTMSAASGAIAIHVDTRGATFPVDVDPLVWIPQPDLAASDGAAGDDFGISVAVSGGTAVVGAYAKTVNAKAKAGAAYVFVQTGTTWSQQQELTPSDGAASDYFGACVSVSAGIAVVCAPAHTVGSNAAQGAAYVFVQNGSTWSQQQELTASDGAAGDRLGSSVSISGGTLVAGAYGVNSTQGAAYVFVQNGTTWSQQQKLTASDGVPGDYLGLSIALSGNIVLAGSTYKNFGANAEQGAAYVFVRNGTTWTQQQKLTASDGAVNDHFGISVGLSGSTAIIGARDKKVGANNQQGAVYVLVQSGTTWTQQQVLTASDGASSDHFGESVTVDGNTAIVGAYGKASGSNVYQGAAYAFVRTGTTWTEQQRLTPSDAATNDYFGYTVGVSGTTAIVGAFGKTVGANTSQGSAYVFNQGPPNGTTCSKPSDCASTFCVDGFCCDTACTGCQACAAVLKPSGKDDGTCGPALTGTNPHKAPCPVDLPATCGHDGLCDGAGACRVHAPSGTPCTTTCASGLETDSACDGNGKCNLGGSKPCGNYVCEATQCKTSCVTTADCSTGYVCQGGKCAAGAVCVGSDSQGGDGKVAACAPYQCDKTDGTCKAIYKSVDDCVAPATCDPSGKCVAPTASNSGGCSTSGGRHVSGDAGAWSTPGSGTTAGMTVFLLMGAITRLRRRSRKNRKMS